MSSIVEEKKGKVRSRICASICLDIFFMLLAVSGAVIVSKDFDLVYMDLIVWTGLNVIVMTTLFLFLSLDSFLYRPARFGEFLRVTLAVIMLVCFNLLYSYLFKKIDMMTCVIMCVIFYVFAFFERLIAKGCVKVQSEAETQENIKRKIMIIGAGKAGMAILKQMQNNQSLRMLPVWFLDDDESKLGKTFFGAQVVGGTKDIQRFTWMFGITNIILATNNVGKEKLEEIKSACEKTNCKIQILPQVQVVLNGENK